MSLRANVAKFVKGYTETASHFIALYYTDKEGESPGYRQAGRIDLVVDDDVEADDREPVDVLGLARKLLELGVEADPDAVKVQIKAFDGQKMLKSRVFALEPTSTDGPKSLDAMLVGAIERNNRVLLDGLEQAQDHTRELVGHIGVLCDGIVRATSLVTKEQLEHAETKATLIYEKQGGRGWEDRAADLGEILLMKKYGISPSELGRMRGETPQVPATPTSTRSSTSDAGTSTTPDQMKEAVLQWVRSMKQADRVAGLESFVETFKADPDFLEAMGAPDNN